MVTISNIVENEVRNQPFLQEVLAKKLINYAALAEEFQPKIEQILRKKVKIGAVIMALRRHADKLEQKFGGQTNSNDLKKIELAMKSNIVVITAVKSSTIFSVLKKLYSLVDFEKGDLMTVTQGSHEVTLIASQKYKQRFLDALKDEKILGKDEDVFAISLKYPETLVYSPGLFYAVTRELAWRDINILEFASTKTELTVIVSKEDSINAYQALHNLTE